MARCEISFRSGALDKVVTCNVVLPDRIEPGETLPVLYLLHGYSDDSTVWLRRTSLERYLDDVRLIVVMPDGGHEFYTNAVTGYDYETFMVEELPCLVRGWFPVDAGLRRQSIGGLSMGGYGAVRLGIKYGDRFASIHAHSGAYDIEHRLQAEDSLPHLQRVFGESVAGTDSDIFHLVRTSDPAVLPAIKIDCGDEDHCLHDNRNLTEALTAAGIDHQYDEYEGGHDWEYWDTHIQEAVAFHMEHLEAVGTRASAL